MSFGHLTLNGIHKRKKFRIEEYYKNYSCTTRSLLLCTNVCSNLSKDKH